MSSDDHFNQKRKRKAEFIKPPNVIKSKVGSGGLSDEILDKTQELLENHSQKFGPLALLYLNSMQKGIEIAKTNTNKADSERVINGMLYPAMQLKANGGMFGYDLVTEISDMQIRFLEVVVEVDTENIEIVIAFYDTLKAIVSAEIKGAGGAHGLALKNALTDACERYFKLYPDRVNLFDFD